MADNPVPASATASPLARQILDAMPDWATATVMLNELVAATLGLSTTDLRCLHALNTGGPATAGALAARIGRTTGAVTRMLDRLDRGGYIRRVADPADRRRVVVEPTRKALTELPAHYEGMGRRGAELLSRFDEHQLRAVLEFVTRGRDDALAEAERLRAESGE
jgi:DNA-binding MarR family transcriptional regulator